MSKSVFEIEKEAKDVKNILGVNEDYFGVDIYSFFDRLKDLYYSLDLLLGKDNKSDADSINSVNNNTRFRFITEYPDNVYDENNLVTFGIVRRKPFINNNRIIGYNVAHAKPVSVGERNNIIRGNVEELFCMEFSNVISLNVFSNKTQTLNTIVRVLETIMYKYSSYIKKYVKEIIYIGANSIQFVDTYNEKEKLLSRELQFHVITSEYFTLETEKIKSIDFIHK